MSGWERTSGHSAHLCDRRGQGPKQGHQLLSADLSSPGHAASTPAFRTPATLSGHSTSLGPRLLESSLKPEEETGVDTISNSPGRQRPLLHPGRRFGNYGILRGWGTVTWRTGGQGIGVWGQVSFAYLCTESAPWAYFSERGGAAYHSEHTHRQQKSSD